MVNENSIIDEICFYTSISKSYIESAIGFCGKKTDYYKSISIPKKQGGYRNVYVPTPELKKIQNFLKEKYFEKYCVSKYATAYVKGRNVLYNANFHVKNKCFLFIDVHDFFDSISFDLLFKIMNSTKEFGLNDERLKIALQICSRNKLFVQGNVTSPILSNIYLKDFDSEMVNIVSKLPNGVYSRYSDDITISSSVHIPDEILHEVELRLSFYKLNLNKRKTHFCSNINNVRITGIRITKDGNLTLDTTFKKKLKTRIFNKLKYGNDSNEDAEELIGLMNYLKMIDFNYYRRLNFKYLSEDGIVCIDRLKLLKKDV